jgi:hypothetical protein
MMSEPRPTWLGRLLCRLGLACTLDARWRCIYCGVQYHDESKC